MGDNKVNMERTWARLRHLGRYIMLKNKNRNIRKLQKFSTYDESNTKFIPDSIVKPKYATSLIYRHPNKVSEIDIKTDEQIEYIRNSCKIARDVLEETASHIRPGITTDQLDTIAHEYCIERKVYPSPLLYRNFPKSICTSVNEVACHGIPSEQILKDGDIINIDVTVFHNGYHGDLSATFPVGEISEENANLIEVSEMCRDEAVSVCGPGVPFNLIGATISELADLTGYSVIPNFCGHGIGEYFHGLPDVLHIENSDETIMKEGMTFTVEPIICYGDPSIKILDDGWTAVTKDKSWTSQFEHTIAITAHGVDILTSSYK